MYRDVVALLGLVMVMLLSACGKEPPPLPSITAENCRVDNMDKLHELIQTKMRMKCAEAGLYKYKEW